MTEPTIACSLSDLADGKPKACQVAGRPVTIVKAGDKVYALDAICPHRGGPLAEGFVQDDCIYCPWHGWGFHLDSGVYVGSPGVGIKTHPTAILDGSVVVKLG
jgi:nitrite reductase/ring-hydroxylating ferredoxin subunit